MVDFSSSEWEGLPQSVSDSRSQVLVKGPIMLLVFSSVFVFLSCSAIVFDRNWLGYALGVVGSGVCIFTAAVDKRRQASVNYSNLSWFSPSVKIVRWLSTLITLAHIVYLARTVGGK